MKKNSQIKSIGNTNNIDDFSVDNATINNLTATNATITNLTVPNVVTSTNNITANRLVKGDTGAKTIKETGLTVDSSDNLTGVNNITSTSGTLTINSITSNSGQNLSLTSSTNQDIIIDAGGSGVIRFNTIQNGGIVFDNQATWIGSTWTNASQGADRILVAGTYHDTEWKPCIGAHNTTITQWKPLWLNFGGVGGSHPVIIGNATSTAANTNTNMLYCVGNMESTGTCRATDYYASGNILCDTSRNITTNNQIINGTITCTTDLYRDITGWLNLSVTGPGGATNYKIVLPSTLSNTVLVKADFFYTMSSYSSGNITVALKDSGGATVSSGLIFADSSGSRLSFGSNNSFGSSQYLNLDINMNGNTGTLYIFSYCITVKK